MRELADARRPARRSRARAALERVRLDRRGVAPRSRVGRALDEARGCTRPASMISRATALASAMSEPTSRPSHTSAHSRRGRARGSIDVRAAPRCARPCSTWWKKIGCVSRAFDAPEDDEVRLLDLAIRARPAARSEDRRQTDDAGGVSGAVAAVDVVAADHGARELLRE